MQGLLYIFYYPEVDDALVSVGSVEELKELVDATKRGESIDDYDGVVFSHIYMDAEPITHTQVGCTLVSSCDNMYKLVLL